MNNRLFVECATTRERKYGEHAHGDTALSRKTDDGRIISVLSDGLGSGIKAGVLSTLSATMMMRCLEHRMDPVAAARSIMRTLPVCSERKIAYATFSLSEVSPSGSVRVVEYDNPPFLFLRGPSEVPVETREQLLPQSARGKAKTLRHPPRLRDSSLEAKTGDRIVMLSDGVTQAGMGSRVHPLGWGRPALLRFVRSLIVDCPDISANKLAERVVSAALSKDCGKAADDITCSVLFFRPPRKLLIVSGPPFHKDNDLELSHAVATFEGKRIVCGGTTAQILSRSWNEPLTVDMRKASTGLPPTATLKGVDLVTEGILTLGALARILVEQDPEQQGEVPDGPWPAVGIFATILDSDIIEFIVGTRINEAHQDPRMPVELEIRRNVIKQIATILKDRYLKEVHVRFL